MKQAERIAQARAKAAALKEGATGPGLPAAANTAASAAPPAVPSSTSASSQDGLKAPGTPTPLHPSLPAKPGTTPVPGESAAASPARVSTPNPPPAAPATPTPPALAPEAAPIVLPPDEQIMKYEEVRISRQRSCALCSQSLTRVFEPLLHFCSEVIELFEGESRTRRGLGCCQVYHPPSNVSSRLVCRHVGRSESARMVGRGSTRRSCTFIVHTVELKCFKVRIEQLQQHYLDLIHIH